MEVLSAAATLAALSQESRLRVFRLLVRVGPGGMAAGSIADELDIPSTTLSFHLKELTNADLVVARRDGRSIIYSPHIDGIRDLMAFLTDDCCQGRPELCSVGADVGCADERCG